MNLEREGIWTSAIFAENHVVFKSPLYRKIFTFLFSFILGVFFLSSIDSTFSLYSIALLLLLLCFILFLMKLFKDKSFNRKYIVCFVNKKIKVYDNDDHSEYTIEKIICRENKNRYPEDPKLCQLYVKTIDNHFFLIHQSFWLNKDKILFVSERLSQLLNVSVEVQFQSK